MKRLVLTVVLLLAIAAGACNAPPLQLVYTVANTPGGQTCGVDVMGCADIKLDCSAVLSVRILSPSDPTQPYVSVCKDIPQNAKRDLCAIASIDLPAVDLPKETLEVQVLVWPKSAVTDPETGELDCLRNEVTFEASQGFPLLVAGEQPAFGGRTFIHPQDEETVVTLGCTYPEAVNGASCSGTEIVAVTSTVIDFESRVSVSAEKGNELTLLVAEPRSSGDGHVFNNGQAEPLRRLVQGPTPTWGDNVELQLDASACVEVIEDTQTLSCHSFDLEMGKPTMLDITGVLLSKASLDQIVDALLLPTVPEEGITIGLVVNSTMPVSGATVDVLVPPGSPSGATVQFLSADRMSFGGTATTSSGIWVSTDAPYGTTFIAKKGGTSPVVTGGRVKGKVTVVIQQLVPSGA